jgi:hypothetical protein
LLPISNNISKNASGSRRRWRRSGSSSSTATPRSVREGRGPEEVERHRIQTSSPPLPNTNTNTNNSSQTYAILIPTRNAKDLWPYYTQNQTLYQGYLASGNGFCGMDCSFRLQFENFKAYNWWDGTEEKIHSVRRCQRDCREAMAERAAR